jgi:hypothetical protein
MARSSSSFTKRQKERARQEKQREKAERKVQRKQEKQPGGPDDDLGVNPSMDWDDEDTADAEAGNVTP